MAVVLTVCKALQDLDAAMQGSRNYWPHPTKGRRHSLTALAKAIRRDCASCLVSYTLFEAPGKTGTSYEGKLVS